MVFALALAAAVPAVPLPPRLNITAHVRILSGMRINLRDPARKPEGAIIRKGLIEFQ
jgi:hypothetical protein